MTTLRVALVGIDGSGKSTLARSLADETGCVALSSLRNHETADAPLRELSSSLDAASTVADLKKSFKLKLAVLYLQLCMFGPTERFYIEALAPSVVLADRHPVVDGAAYLPMLCRQMRADEGTWGHLQVLDPLDVKRICEWCEGQARRLGLLFDPETVSAELAGLADGSSADLLRELAKWTNTSVPDLVVFLDIDIDQAVRRLQVRGGGREIHEDRRLLTEVRTRYEEVLADLGPQRVRRLQVDAMSPAEVTAEALALISRELS